MREAREGSDRRKQGGRERERRWRRVIQNRQREKRQKRVGGGWEREEERRQHAEGRQFFGFLVGFEREWKFVMHRVATAIANERPV